MKTKHIVLAITGLFIFSACNPEFPTEKLSGCVNNPSTHPCTVDSRERIPYRISSTDDVKITIQKGHTGLELCGSSMKIQIAAQLHGVFDYYKGSCSNQSTYGSIDSTNQAINVCRDQNNPSWSCSVTQCRETTESWQNIDSTNCNRYLNAFSFISLKKNADGTYSEIGPLTTAIKTGCTVGSTPQATADIDGIRMKADVQWAGTSTSATGTYDVYCR